MENRKGEEDNIGSRPCNRETPAQWQHYILLRPVTLATLSLLLGLFYLLLTAPFQVPDEPAHFLRAFQISRGDLRGEKLNARAGGFIPKRLKDELYVFDHLKFKPEIQISYDEWRQKIRKSLPLTVLSRSETAFLSFSNTVLQSPVPYLPQALGLIIAEGLAWNTLEALYLSRFLTLLACIALLAVSLSLCAFSDRLCLTIFLLATMPMNIFLLASISADALTISLALVTVALCIRLTQQWSAKLFGWLLLSSGLLSLCKVFFLIPLMGLPAIWLAPLQRRLQVGAAAALVGAAVLPLLAWSSLAATLVVPFRPDVDPHLQLKFVLEQPLTALRVFCSSLTEDFWGIWLSFIGVLGWLDTLLPPRVYRYYPLLLGLAVVTGISSQELPRRNTRRLIWVAAGIFLATVFLICLSQYLLWTPVGAPHLKGLQGRYFLPLAPMLLLCLPPVFYLKEKWYRVFTAVVFLGWGYLSVIVLAALGRRYWG